LPAFYSSSCRRKDLSRYHPPEHVKAILVRSATVLTAWRKRAGPYTSQALKKRPRKPQGSAQGEGKRIVVFAVAGTIHLKEPLDISRPYVTSQARLPSTWDNACRSTDDIRTHDVIVRHIRSRPGDGPGFDPEDRDGFRYLMRRCHP
jgi:hypothetical protein